MNWEHGFYGMWLAVIVMSVSFLCYVFIKFYVKFWAEVGPATMFILSVMVIGFLIGALLTACAQGPRGETGTPGLSFVGPQGAAASPCAVRATDLGVVVTCPDGSTQTVYNGLDGNSVEPVQLCPGIPTTYPTSFPEYAFCIGGKLYAVYWDGSHAFDAYIPPGQYASTSRQGCTFTVLAGCTLQ